MTKFGRKFYKYVWLSDEKKLATDVWLSDGKKLANEAARENA